MAFAEDRAGCVWIGMYPKGLVRDCGGHFQSIQSVPPGTVNALLADREGRLWVASSQGGLGCVDDPNTASPRMRRYGAAEGLRSDQLFDLAQDHYGRIYVAGGQGVDRLDSGTGYVYHFAASGGPPPGEIQRLYCDRTGAVWFASNFGLARYEPQPEPTGTPQAPAIRALHVSGIPVLASDEGEPHFAGGAFPAGRNSIEIGYSSVDFSPGNELRYRYRLLPLEKRWGQPTRSRSVRYAAIGPNSYRFEVQSVGPSGAIGAGVASLEFRILGPVWTRWWFLLLAACGVAGLAYAAHLYRLRHLLAVERVRAGLAADLHDDLGSGLVEITILTEVARRRARLPELAMVADRARELRGTLSDIVWSVDPASDNPAGLVRRWRETAFNLVGNESLTFSAAGIDENDQVTLAPDRRRHLLLLFKEVMTNIARHARARHVRVDVRCNAVELSLEVRDDGCGFQPGRPNSGNGLKSIAQRAERLRATLAIESRPGGGTIVRLKAPLRPKNRMTM
jgi:signal transduction histidine kinase